MKKILGVAILVMFAATFSGCATTENKSDAKMDSAKPVATEQQSNLNVERSNVATTTAKVLAVDLKTRMVKLRSLEGKPFTIRVGKEAVNLPQVRVGDTVEVTYAQSLEVRMAEPGEIRADTKGVVGRAKPGYNRDEYHRHNYGN
jgi:lipoprotein-anchoring transpeptidase ErfK/SrfK